MSKLLFLIRDDHGTKSNGRALGSRLMEQGHTVFLSDTDEDLEFFGDVVDAFVEISPDAEAPQAVLYAVGDRQRPSRKALREKAVLQLPADDAALTQFAGNIGSTP